METSLLRHTLRLVKLPPLPDPGPDPLAGCSVLVFNGVPRARHRVAEAVKAAGGAVWVWDGDPEALDGEPCPDAIVDLGPPCAMSAVSADAWRAPMSRTVEVLRHVYPVWGAETRMGRLRYLAVTGMGGSMGMRSWSAAQPLGGLWAGLTKTLPREFPASHPRVLDLDPRDLDRLGPAVVAELCADPLLEVGRVGDERVTLMAREAPVDGATVDLGPSDTLLFTGGARGIGFEIALEMAVAYGCTVVVTGRDELPEPGNVWLSAGEKELEARERDLYARRGDKPVKQVRREIRRMRQAREVWRNLCRAGEAGARVSYRVCDVTRRDDVARLLAELGDGLSVVVHNAGVDNPARLARKTTEDFLGVISVKIDGLFNLLDGLGERPLKMLCLVGSQTGRYGGMPGQFDYAAANDGLARMGAWLGHRLSYPVKTIAWPTWESLGLITNLGAASRYMRPIPVRDGVRAWRAELTRGGSGEIGYMGEIGEVAPQYLNGISVPPGWSGRAGMLTKRFLLGDVTVYAPGRELESVHLLHADWATCLSETRVDGGLAVPVSLLLEYMYSAAWWLAPHGDDAPPRRGLRAVTVRPRAARLANAEALLVRKARAGWRQTAQGTAEWVIDVRIFHGRECAAQGEIVHADGALVTSGVPRTSRPAAEGPPVAGRAGYRWEPAWCTGDLWEHTADGWTTRVAPIRATDLFTLRDAPVPELPSAHLESIVRFSPGAPRDVWGFEHASFAEAPEAALSASAVVFRPGLRQAAVLTADGDEVAVLHGPRWSTEEREP